MVTHAELLRGLNEVDFPRRYWEFCERFPSAEIELGRTGRNEDIRQAFKDMEANARRVDSRVYYIEEEEIGGVVWSGKLTKKTYSHELDFYGLIGDEYHAGGEWASLAFETARLADPSFDRNPRFPRPEHNGDPGKLQELVREFVSWTRTLQEVVRKLESEKGA